MKISKIFKLKNTSDYINLAGGIGVIVYLFVYRMNMIAGMEQGLSDFTSIFK